jgi:hypothetical protein
MPLAGGGGGGGGGGGKLRARRSFSDAGIRYGVQPGSLGASRLGLLLWSIALLPRIDRVHLPSERRCLWLPRPDLPRNAVSPLLVCVSLASGACSSGSVPVGCVPNSPSGLTAFRTCARRPRGVTIITMVYSRAPNFLNRQSLIPSPLQAGPGVLLPVLVHRPRLCDQLAVDPPIRHRDGSVPSLSWPLLEQVISNISVITSSIG